MQMNVIANLRAGQLRQYGNREINAVDNDNCMLAYISIYQFTISAGADLMWFCLYFSETVPTGRTLLSVNQNNVKIPFAIVKWYQSTCYYVLCMYGICVYVKQRLIAIDAASVPN